jgi:predicted CoA-substrate-specific enzyme activase
MQSARTLSEEVPAIFFAGIDLGSTMTKIVILDEGERAVAAVVKHTGAEHRRLAGQVMQEALGKASLAIDDITYIVATGYGRIKVPFADRHFTELTCHARGVAKLFPEVRAAIDIGGQDSKVLQIRHGKLVDFVMNDKCAAGTGRFLEILAGTLALKVEDLGPLSLKAERKATIASPCTVFIQQEVAIHLSNGVPIEEIVAGLHNVIAAKVAKMAKRFKLEPDVVFTGGVAKNTGVVRALEENLGCVVRVPEEPLFSGASGAALMGREIVLKALSSGETIPRTTRCLDDAKFFS